jgi:uncharacterized protein YcaQ
VLAVDVERTDGLEEQQVPFAALDGLLLASGAEVARRWSKRPNTTASERNEPRRLTRRRYLLCPGDAALRRSRRAGQLHR